MRTISFVLAGLCLSVFTAGCGLLFLPTGEATVRATSTISVDGQHYTGSSIWRVKATTQNGWPFGGINYNSSVLGDAIEFRLADGVYAFLRPHASYVLSCARSEHPEVQYRAQALPKFIGPCNSEPAGRFTVVTLGAGGEPTFVNFSAGPRGFLNDGGASDLPPEVQALADRGFGVVSLAFSVTTEPLPTNMTERFPWILKLPRWDVCYSGPPVEGNYCTSRGTTYAQFFTTALPT